MIKHNQFWNKWKFQNLSIAMNLWNFLEKNIDFVGKKYIWNSELYNINQKYVLIVNNILVLRKLLIAKDNLMIIILNCTKLKIHSKNSLMLQIILVIQFLICLKEKFKL
jgi:hypothetical protein